jgi:hypothetical protein
MNLEMQEDARPGATHLKGAGNILMGISAAHSAAEIPSWFYFRAPEPMRNNLLNLRFGVTCLQALFSVLLISKSHAN